MTALVENCGIIVVEAQKRSPNPLFFKGLGHMLTAGLEFKDLKISVR